LIKLSGHGVIGYGVTWLVTLLLLNLKNLLPNLDFQIVGFKATILTCLIICGKLQLPLGQSKLAPEKY
jgi:hypothetical protein